MNIAVLGSQGQLGRDLVPRLAGRVVSLTRGDIDLAKPDTIAPVLAALRPDVLVNCAAYNLVDKAEADPDAANAVNSRGVGVLALICNPLGVRLVHFSTDYVFDGTITRPLRPDDPVGPQSAYGKSKLLGEQAIQQAPPQRWMILRTAWLYGAGGPNFVQTMVNVARAGKPLKVVNDQVGSPTYTMDLAQATLELLDAGASGVYHVTNSGQTTWFDFAAAIFQEFGLQPSLSATSSDEWKSTRPDSAIRPRYSVLDGEPVAKLLGRPMRPWREALRAFKAEVDARRGF